MEFLIIEYKDKISDSIMFRLKDCIKPYIPDCMKYITSNRTVQEFINSISTFVRDELFAKINIQYKLLGIEISPLEIRGLIDENLIIKNISRSEYDLIKRGIKSNDIEQYNNIAILIELNVDEYMFYISHVRK